jgi:hypothetical protein
MNFNELPFLSHFEIEKFDINAKHLKNLKSKYGFDIPSDFIKFLNEVGNMTMNQSKQYLLMPTLEGLNGEHFDGISGFFLREYSIENMLSEENYYNIILDNQLFPVGLFCFSGQRILFMGYGENNYNNIYIYDYELCEKPIYVTHCIESFFKEILYIDDFIY